MQTISLSKAKLESDVRSLEYKVNELINQNTKLQELVEFKNQLIDFLQRKYKEILNKFGENSILKTNNENLETLEFDNNEVENIQETLGTTI